MRAAVYHGPRDVRVEEVPDASLREPTDALVRVTHACICGSDLWPYRGRLEIYGRPGRTGHEFMGVVEAVGADVRTIRPGSASSPPSPSRTAPATNATGASRRRAAPVATGAVGLCAVPAARRLGAERVIALGHHAERLEIARRFGATDIVVESGEEAVARVREMTGGGAAHVLECVGTPGSFATAIGAARPGGVVGHVGVPAEPVDLLAVHQRNVRTEPGGRAGACLHPRAARRRPRGHPRPLARARREHGPRRRARRLRRHGRPARHQGARAGRRAGSSGRARRRRAR